jgi:hypothetical protein
MNAKAHINGNSPRDFVLAQEKLADAINQMQDALRTVRVDLFHGRNYQHLPEEARFDARQEDLLHFDTARRGLLQLEVFYAELVR